MVWPAFALAAAYPEWVWHIACLHKRFSLLLSVVGLLTPPKETNTGPGFIRGPGAAPGGVASTLSACVHACMRACLRACVCVCLWCRKLAV